MIKLYASLYTAIHSIGGTFRGRIEMAMSNIMPQKSKRVQNWLQNFVRWNETVCAQKRVKIGISSCHSQRKSFGWIC